MKHQTEDNFDYNNDITFSINNAVDFMSNPKKQNITEQNISDVLKRFDELKLGRLDFCGNEDHECECEVKKDEIKQFISRSFTSLVEQLRVEEENIDTSKMNDWEATEVGKFLSASNIQIRKFNSKISELLK